MAKDFIISTSRLNGRGFRVLTPGIDTGQFKKNPVLLYMHRRCFDGTGGPIGRVENLRVEGDELRGTPVFDTGDPFAAGIARKWEEDFIRACSAGLEPVETSSSPGHLLPGQTRPTITRSRLIEVSIVDIGANDDALRLYSPDGKLVELAAGAVDAFLPLLETNTPPAGVPAGNNNDQKLFMMKNILLALGLPETATGEEAVAALGRLQEAAKRVEALELARVEAAVDAAIATRRATADKRDSLVALGKSAGYDALKLTLDLLPPSRKPSEIIHPLTGVAGGVTLSYGQMSEAQLQELRRTNREEFLRLFEAEFGHAPRLDE
ncbi:MAG: hypothetical protein LBP56_07615 [Odoribacteraceae bacterium]|jgi:hypothetical protein|nr:hypothetical protein [Odoribacteraceae bacterium]